METSNIFPLFHFRWQHTHNTSFVHKIQKPLVEFLKQRLPNVTKIYYVSDGCGGQYKNFKNFLNLCSHKVDFSIKAEWIFFATSHGKSTCDGTGGVVKCHGCKMKFTKTTQQPNSGLPCSAGSMPRRNEVHYLLWHWQRRPGWGETEKMKKRFEDGKMAPGTRSGHHFIPQFASQIGHKLKLCSENHWFVDIHDLKIPTRVDTGDIALSPYIFCMHNSLWWVSLVNKVDDVQGDVHVQLMHPHGLQKIFN